MVDISPNERTTIRTLHRLASGSPGERQEAIDRCEAIDVVTELMREHYRDGRASVEIRFNGVPESVWIEQDGDRAWYSGNVKRDEIAPGLAVEWSIL